MGNKWSVGLILLVMLACQPKAAQQTFSAYNWVEFQLPADWQADRGQLTTEVSGGYGFASPDYAGLSYLRLHQGAVFAVMGDWDFTENAASALKTAFVENISEVTPIQVLGVEGTYAHGQLEQGQGIGAVHVMVEIGGEMRQLIFLGTVANYWENYEDSFLEIVKTLKLSNLE